MASDHLVAAKHLLQAITQVQRRGDWALIADLEKLEPELAEYLMEMLSTLHQEVAATGASHRRVRRIDCTAQELAIVCIAALRAAHFDLWRDSPPGNWLVQPETRDNQGPGDDDHDAPPRTSPGMDPSL